jgi:hypothetical protein
MELPSVVKFVPAHVRQKGNEALLCALNGLSGFLLPIR